ncbi:hypothetical protein C0993_010641 [Termitomyces sp. T159_Od127]|nr:hypothetical protein C0993_010641 [Termitomyces sp. T159_Od127]
MMYRLSSLLLCLATSVAAISIPQIQRGVTHRAVEILASPVPSIAIEVSPTVKTKSAASELKVLDSVPSFLIGTQTGDATFYPTGLGACGIVNKDTDHIAAVSHLLFDAFPYVFSSLIDLFPISSVISGYNGLNPNTNPLCGKKVSVSYGGKSVVVTLTDRCEGCALTDLDLSPAAFDVLADPSVGRLHGMTWKWLD